MRYKYICLAGITAFLGLSMISCGNNASEANAAVEEVTEATTAAETTRATEARKTYSNNDSSYSGISHSSSSKSSSRSAYSNYDNGVHVNKKSSYWYDSPSERKRKADETLMKYYEYDENGNLVKKEGTIVNGKPYHKNK